MTSKTFKYGILKICLFSCVNTIIFIRSSCLHIRSISRGSLIIGVEDGGGGGLRNSIEPPQTFYKGGSAPAEILLNLIAVTIPSSPSPIHVQYCRIYSIRTNGVDS